jgi:DNA-binding MarR family transcriptional regulator
MTVALQDLGQAVKQLQYRHHRALDNHLRQIGTTLAQWDALRAIARRPDSSGHALAEMTFQTDQSFGALASRLVQRGMIERVAGPGRAIRHRLTPAGEATLQKGHGIADEVLADSFSTLTDSQRDQLYRLLTRSLAAPPAGDRHARTGAATQAG